MLSKPNKIVASDLRFVQLVDNLGARQVACFVEKRNARNESKLFPELSAFAESSPRALRRESSVHCLAAAPILVQSFQFTVTND